MLKSNVYLQLCITSVLLTLLAIGFAEKEPPVSEPSVNNDDESSISNAVDACGKDVRKNHEDACNKKHGAPVEGCTLHPKAVLCLLNHICKDCDSSAATETVKFMKKIASNGDSCDHSAFTDFECPSVGFRVLKSLSLAIFIVIPLIVLAVLLVVFLRKKYVEAQQAIGKTNSLSTDSQMLSQDSKLKKRKKKKDKSTSKSDKTSSSTRKKH